MCAFIEAKVSSVHDQRRRRQQSGGRSDEVSARRRPSRMICLWHRQASL